MKLIAAALVLLGFTAFSVWPDEMDTSPSLAIGAEVYAKRCALCHGSQGMGEGMLPMKLAQYPNTNLRQQANFKSRSQVHDVVAHGASLAQVSDFMPPMGDDLTWTELESVVDFILFLRDSPEDAIAMLSELDSAHATADVKIGREVFAARCTLCHGQHGEGDGRMSKIIKSPPPANLVKSLVPKAYISMIVAQGGEKVGRSPQMPPWGDQLTETEIASVVEYLLTLRQ